MKFLAIAAAFALLPAVMVNAQQAPVAKPKTEAGTMRLYKGQNFSGENYMVDTPRSSLMLEMNVGSIAVFPGEKWEVCDKPRFKGNCNIVDRDMSGLGEVAIQSARPVKQ